VGHNDVSVSRHGILIAGEMHHSPLEVKSFVGYYDSDLDFKGKPFDFSLDIDHEAR